jgi:hypothetical protein
MTHAGPPQYVLLAHSLLSNSRCQTPLSTVRRRMVTAPMTVHGRVAVPPAVSIVAAISVGISRSQVLAICVRVELRAIAGVFDNSLRQSGSCESCADKSGANQYEFHSGLLLGFGSRRWGRAPILPTGSLAPSSKIQFNGAGGRTALHRLRVHKRSRQIMESCHVQDVGKNHACIARFPGACRFFCKDAGSSWNGKCANQWNSARTRQCRWNE